MQCDIAQGHQGADNNQRPALQEPVGNGAAVLVVWKTEGQPDQSEPAETEMYCWDNWDTIKKKIEGIFNDEYKLILFFDYIVASLHQEYNQRVEKEKAFTNE